MNKKIIKYNAFPEHFVSDEEKNDDSFGLKMGKAIESEWFMKSSGSACRFYDTREKYHNLRLYARGEQSTKKYKDLLNGDDGDSYTNFDWTPLQIAPKFVKLITNQMTERLFEIRATAVDKYSTNLKDDYKQMLEDYVVTKPFLEDAKNMLGVDMLPPNHEELPETQEEVDLHMALEYKPAIEIATEEAIKYVLELNDYDDIQSRVVEDIVTIGIGGVKHLTDKTKGIVVEYVDPANMVYSTPKNRSFKDVHYYGEYERITVNELKRRTQGELTDEQLEELSQQSFEWDKYQGTTNERYYNAQSGDLGGRMVNILNFTFKSTNTINYKKKYLKNGGYKLRKKESTFSKKNKDYSGYDVVKKTIDVWYKGSLILGTETIFDYGLVENMIRPKGYLNITIPNYIMFAPEIYQNRTKSLIGRVIPYIDQMQQVHIKLQQLIAKAKPNGIYIDVDGLEEISLGDGNFLSPLEVIRIYNQTGNVLGSSITAEGEYNYGKEPIRELKNGVVDGLDRLIGVYNHYLGLLRDAIGIPAGADASMPHPDTLVGVQQQVMINSNTATRHILESMLSISKMLGKSLSLRLKDIFKYSDLKNVFINAIGQINVDILNSIKDYHLHDLGINIELKPDAIEKQQLESSIMQSLQQQLITLDDANDIRTIGNIKLGNALLKVRRKRREKEKRDHENNLAKIQQEGSAKSAQIAQQTKQMEISLKKQSDLEIIEAKKRSKIAEIMAEKQAKSELMQQEFDYNMTLKGVETEVNQHFEKMKHGHNKELKNLNFESSEDHISGGIDMGELEPH